MIPTQYLSNYKKLPVSVKLLSTPLILFLCLWTLGTVGFIVFSNLNLEGLVHKEIEDRALLFQTDLQQEQELLNLKAHGLSQRQSIIEAVAASDRPLLTGHILPTQTELDLDWIAIVGPNDQLLGSVSEPSLDGIPLPVEGLNRSLKPQVQDKLDRSEIRLVDHRNGVSLVSVRGIYASTHSTERLATLVVGMVIDHDRLNHIQGDTSIDLAIVQGDRVLASTLSIIPEFTRPFPQTHESPTWVDIGPETYLVKTAQLEDTEESGVHIAILKSIQELEDAEQRMYWVVGGFGILGGGLVAGVTALGFRFTQALSRRLHDLTQATQQLADGKLTVRLPIGSQDEVGILAQGFNDMAEELTLRDQQLKQKMQQLKSTLQELHHTQSQMVQNEKMAALGQMIAGIAHEINNPVNFISANVKFIKQYAEELIDLLTFYQEECPQILPSQSGVEGEDLDFIKKDFMKIIQSIKMGSTRIQDIVTSLRNFSRLDEAAFKKADLHEGIDNTLMILKYRCDASPEVSGIDIIKDYGQLPLVECYPGYLNQVFMNLLSNAIDAVESAVKDGKKDLKHDPPSALTREGGKIWVSTNVIDDKTVQIAIADNGLGMSEDVQSRIFDPFFTTKPVGKGTGLGLSISHQIITERHLGQIWCESEPGKGTKFIIAIPIYAEESVSETPKIAANTEICVESA